MGGAGSGLALQVGTQRMPQTAVDQAVLRLRRKHPHPGPAGQGLQLAPQLEAKRQLDPSHLRKEALVHLGFDALQGALDPV